MESAPLSRPREFTRAEKQRRRELASCTVTRIEPVRSVEEMRRLSVALTLLSAVALLCAPSSQLSGQDSLRVLRLQPDSAATPVAPVVVTFDHPVAPRLDESLDPEKVLTIVPNAP